MIHQRANLALIVTHSETYLSEEVSVFEIRRQTFKSTKAFQPQNHPEWRFWISNIFIDRKHIFEIWPEIMTLCSSLAHENVWDIKWRHRVVIRVLDSSQNDLRTFLNYRRKKIFFIKKVDFQKNFDHQKISQSIEIAKNMRKNGFQRVQSQNSKFYNWQIKIDASGDT